MAVPRRSPLSLVVTPAPEVEQAVHLTDDECDAVRELGLRPTYSLTSAPEIGVEAMLANATAWMQAAEVTSAANAGWIPPTLRREIAGLLSEAVPEAVLDLESVIQRRNRWRSGDAGQGFPQLGREDTEALYAELIENEQHNTDALMSISEKLDLPGLRALAHR